MSKSTKRQFREMLQLAVNEQQDGLPVLRALADALVKRGRTGDVQAIREIADRLDGKVPQAIVGDDEHPPVSVIERRIVDPEGASG